MAIAVKVISDSEAARSDLAKLRASVDTISSAADNVTKSFKTMAVGLAASIASFATVRMLIEVNDTLTSMASKLKIVTGTIEDFSIAMKDTRDIALATRSGLSDVVTLYSKVTNSAKSFGASQQDISVFVQNVTKAIQMSGATAQETQAVILQLGQALGSGKLQGDELRSITENAQMLSQTIADGLGVTIGQMRALGAEGRLTSKDVFEAIMSQTDKLKSKANSIGVTYGQAFENLKTAGLVLFETLKNGGRSLDATAAGATGQHVKTLAEHINDLALTVNYLATHFDWMMVKMEIDMLSFVQHTIDGFKKIPDAIRDSFGNIKSALPKLDLNINIKKINISDFIPNIMPMAKMVQDWCVIVERAFFWVYDRVIGHSWIPDLVEGIISWTSKLVDAPLTFVKKFTNFTEEAFRMLADKVSSMSFVKPILTQVKQLTDMLNSTTLIHNMKLVMGVQDKTFGVYPNRTVKGGFSVYDNEAPVSKGAHRHSGQGLFENIVNTFKSENQIPFIATVATALTTGLVTAISSGSVIKGTAAMFGIALVSAIGGSYDRMVPIGIMIGAGILAALKGGMPSMIAAIATTGFGLIAARTVSDKEVNLTTGELFSNVLKAITWLSDKLFTDKDPFGILLLIAKLSLIFKSGREYIGNLAIGAATAPTRIASVGTQMFDRKLLDFRADRADERAKAMTIESATKLSDASKQFRDVSYALARSVDPTTGKRTQGLLNAVNSGSVSPNQLYGSQAIEAQRFIVAKQALVNAQLAAQAQAQTIKDTQMFSSKLREASNNISTKLAETAENTKQSAINMGGAAGGILGSVWGFQLGGKIAEGMVGYSDWAKVGVQLMTAGTMQMVGASIGGAIVATIIGTAGSIAAILASPLTIVAVTTAALISAAFAPEKAKEFADVLMNMFIDAGKVLAKAINDILPDKLKTSTSKIEKGQTLLNPFYVADKATEVVTRLGEPIKDTYNFVKNASSEIFSKLGQEFTGALSAIGNFIIPSANASEDSRKSYNKEGANQSLIRQSDNETIKSVSIAIKDSTDNAFDRLVAAIRTTESGNVSDNSDITSFKGAKGAMQIIESTFTNVAKQHNLDNVSFDSAADRIKVAILHLSDLWTKYSGDVRLTAAAYNAGEGAVKDGEIRPGFSTKDASGKIVMTAKKYADIVEQRFNKLSGETVPKVFDNVTKTVVSSADDMKDAGSNLFGDLQKTLSKALDNAPPSIKKLGNSLLATFDELMYSIGAKQKTVVGAGTATEDTPEKSKPVEVEKIKTFTEQINSMKTVKDAVDAINKELADNSITDKIEVADIKNIPDDVKNIVQQLEYLQTANALVKKFKDEGSEFAAGIAKSDANKIINILTKELKEAAIRRKEGGDGKVMSGLAMTAGTDYIKTFQESTAAGFKQVLIGNKKGKDFLKDIADQFTDTIVTQFAKAFMNSLTKKLGIDKMMGDLVSNIFDMGEKAVEKSIGLFKKDKPKDSSIERPGSGWIGNTGVNLPQGVSNEVAKMASGGGITEDAKEIVKATTSSSDELQKIISGSSDLMQGNIISGLGKILSGGFNMVVQAIQALLSLATGGSAAGGAGGIMSGLGNAFSGIGSWLSGLGGASSAAGAAEFAAGASDLIEVAAIMAATGGYITKNGPVKHFEDGGTVFGPGSGTSDSIPAMLSNGEFVVNAAATSRNLALLHAINGNTLPKFADGGRVGSTTTSQGIQTLLGNKQHNQTFNINVTGDISQQTRKEIQLMIPQIATGVNMHNYERGNRR